MAGADDLSGGHVIAISHRTVRWAVDQLLGLGTSTLAHLKIRSGEHLAAILLTAFIGSAPRSVDTGGEVDLLFELGALDGRHELLGSLPLASFEVKSIAGPFREVDSRIDRMSDSGVDARGLGVSVKVERADEILIDARPLLRKAEARLSVKVGDAVSKHAFLIVHPFDRFALEAVTHPIVAPLLEPLPDVTRLDTVWVLWVPDHLTMWSRNKSVWTEMFFRAATKDEVIHGPHAELSVLQDAESEFLARVRPSYGSPYLFGLVAKTFLD